MMADIKMIKYHSLPMPQARALVQRAADNLAQEYDLVSKWAGNTLHFRRSGVQGEMSVSASEIHLEVTLGFLLKAFKAKFVEHIEHNFDTLLAEAHAEHRSAKPLAAPRERAAKGAAAKKTIPTPAKKAARKRST
jgi:putative polyhydroxyalkanoate system protein